MRMVQLFIIVAQSTLIATCTLSQIELNCGHCIIASPYYCGMRNQQHHSHKIEFGSESTTSQHQGRYLTTLLWSKQKDLT